MSGDGAPGERRGGKLAEEGEMARASETRREEGRVGHSRLSLMSSWAASSEYEVLYHLFTFQRPTLLSFFLVIVFAVGRSCSERPFQL